MKGTIIKKEDSGESYQGKTMFFCTVTPDGATESLEGVTYQDAWNVGDEIEFEAHENKRHGITFKKPQTGEWGGNRSNSAVDKYEAKKAGETDERETRAERQERQLSIIRQSSLKVATDIILSARESQDTSEITWNEVKKLTKEIESFVKEV